MASFFNEAYRGSPPWDIGRPQAEFVGVAREGGIRGSVLDVGCGTRENAILFAGLALLNQTTPRQHRLNQGIGCDEC